MPRSETSQKATLQPSATSCRTSSRPMPEPPPVTTASRPARSFIVLPPVSPSIDMRPALASMARPAFGAKQPGRHPFARIGRVDHLVDLEIGRRAERLAAGIGGRDHLVEQRAALGGIAHRLEL